LSFLSVKLESHSASGISSSIDGSIKFGLPAKCWWDIALKFTWSWRIFSYGKLRDSLKFIKFYISALWLEDISSCLTSSTIAYGEISSTICDGTISST